MVTTRGGSSPTGVGLTEGAYLDRTDRRLVNSATLPSRRSRSALVATVVPWANGSTPSEAVILRP